LSVTFLAAHVQTATADSFIDIRWWHALVPFTGSYRQPWLEIAALSLDLFIAVAVTSALRHRMSHRPWRAVHVLPYAAWGHGLIHGMQGIDSAAVWGNALNYGSMAAVLTGGPRPLWPAGALESRECLNLNHVSSHNHHAPPILSLS
jgi:methionine sulfoxide reductase heme-binding subunit